MERDGRLPGWLIDGTLALTLAGVAVAVERFTQGRIDNRDILLVVGLGGFLLLRGGALLAAAGRTLGCLYAFAISWVLPCIVALFFVANPDLSNIVRDSVPFFVLLGFIVIVIMTVTFERVRREDARRFARQQPAPP